jgi:2-keto-4-pentenoate hydratase/2-oxohepta-3-ene-1,7-dioic acid hydratase in catechol pathway
VRIASYGQPGDHHARFGVVLNPTDPSTETDVIEVADLTGSWNGVADALELLMVANENPAVVQEAMARAPRANVLVAQLLPPVRRPGKFLAIGFNYRAHADEVAAGAGTAPLFFNKQVTCIAGPQDSIPLPDGCNMLDYEGELALVIGARCRNVPVDRAHEVVGGWMACNDVSAREWQREIPTITLGKSHDGFGPIGPWVVTPDEIEDPQNLSIRTTVNGELRQDGHSSDMIHSISEQIAFLSARCTLEVGDLLTTGSPAGSGQGRTPPTWLESGDVVKVVVEGVGVLENTITSVPADVVIDLPVAHMA